MFCAWTFLPNGRGPDRVRRGERSPGSSTSHSPRCLRRPPRDVFCLGDTHTWNAGSSPRESANCTHRTRGPAASSVGTRRVIPSLPADGTYFTLEERMELDTPVELLDSLLFVVGVMLEQLMVRATYSRTGFRYDHTNPGERSIAYAHGAAYTPQQ